MRESQYCVVIDEKTHCPLCDKSVTLLQDIKIRRRMPMFYICYRCNLVFEVGRGQVKYDVMRNSRLSVAIAEEELRLKR